MALTRPKRRRFQTENEGEVSLMEQHNEELRAHLMATDQQFRDLAAEHAQFHKELEAIEAKEHLTLEDEAEEIRLKKQKLRLKDEMNAIMARYRDQKVA
ncbi:MAG: YdcH family protein [Acidobacteriia bacterium]|nr:YdcH family protein [Terriglobia bacterium]